MPQGYKAMTRSGILPFPQKAEQLSTSSPTESVVSILLQKSWQNLIQKRSRDQQKKTCGRSFLIGCRSLKHLQTPGLRVLGLLCDGGSNVVNINVVNINISASKATSNNTWKLCALPRPLRPEYPRINCLSAAKPLGPWARAQEQQQTPTPQLTMIHRGLPHGTAIWRHAETIYWNCCSWLVRWKKSEHLAFWIWRRNPIWTEITKRSTANMINMHMCQICKNLCVFPTFSNPSPQAPQAHQFLKQLQLGGCSLLHTSGQLLFYTFNILRHVGTYETIPHARTVAALCSISYTTRIYQD